MDRRAAMALSWPMYRVSSLVDSVIDPVILLVDVLPQTLRVEVEVLLVAVQLDQTGLHPRYRTAAEGPMGTMTVR